MSLRYDAAFYVQVLDKYVATGECAEADNEPLYAYLLSVMNDPMIKIQVLSDELCARIFYDAMSQFIRLNLEKQKYNMQKSQKKSVQQKKRLGTRRNNVKFQNQFLYPFCLMHPVHTLLATGPLSYQQS